MEPCCSSCCSPWLQPPLHRCGHGVRSQPWGPSVPVYREGQATRPPHNTQIPCAHGQYREEGNSSSTRPTAPAEQKPRAPLGVSHKADRRRADQLCSKRTHAGFQQSPSSLRTHKSSVSVICSGILPRVNREVTGSSFPEPGEVVGYLGPMNE